jgi:hypothetical protein
MIEILQQPKTTPTILMSEMEPLEIGVIVSSENTFGNYEGHYVMRTASESHFEVMDLTKGEVGGCWTIPSMSIEVRLLEQGESITIKLEQQ